MFTSEYTFSYFALASSIKITLFIFPLKKGQELRNGKKRNIQLLSHLHLSHLQKRWPKTGSRVDGSHASKLEVSRTRVGGWAMKR